MEQQVIQKEAEHRERKANVTGIPTQMKLDFERRSGLSFDDVRVHYNSDKPRKIGALAYTQIPQVHIGPGQERHLRHELGHVVQQKRGIVRPNRKSPMGIPINTDPALEYQADLLDYGVSTSVKHEYTPQAHPVRIFGESVLQAKHVFESKEEIDDHFHTTVNMKNLDAVETRAPFVREDTATTEEESIEPHVIKKPTMIYESMGVDENTFNEIRRITENYVGNTLLVFGLNMRCSSENGATISCSFEDDFNSFFFKYNKIAETIQTIERQIRGASDGTTEPPMRYIHNIYFFPFWWASPRRARGYLMPYIEARTLIMQKAQSYVDKNCSSSDSASILFRWIDGDARGDEMNMGPQAISYIVRNKSPVVATGAYLWRSENPLADPNYAEFITALNKEECELRVLFYKLKTAKKAADLDSGKTYPFVLCSEDTSSYYFPETALIMNSHMHNILANVPMSTDEETQDRESMRMVKNAEAKRGIDFASPPIFVLPVIPAFKISKPIKNEGGSGSYLGKELQEIVKKEKKKYSFDEFCVALSNLRQSVFDNKHWHFTHTSADAHWRKTPSTIEGMILSNAWKQNMLNNARCEAAIRLAQCDFLKDIIKDTPRH